MSEFRDPFPELPQVVDIGDDRYFMGPQKPIELGFKSRADFINSFGNEQRTEYLIRKYMFIDLTSKRKLKFSDPAEKKELIELLKKRLKSLKSSQEFTSSTLKNTLIQRSYLNIQRLIQQLEGPEYKGMEFPGMPDISLPCTKAKKYIREIPEDRLFQLVLEIAWYLLHPDKVDKSVQCDWAKTIKQLDTLRIGDIVSQIKTAQKEEGIISDEQPFNYFKRINLETVMKAEERQNALEEAKQMALKMQGETVNENMKQRLETLLNILEMKKYLSNDLPVDKDRLKIIDTTSSKKIENSLISNPMRGGASKTIEKPLGTAMTPFFSYFKAVFDPIYSLLETSIISYSSKNNVKKTTMIPQLSTLLHICNNIDPSDTVTAGQHTYGIYRVTNIDADLIAFINTMLTLTNSHVENLVDDAKRNIFNRQLFHLPKVRLSTLLNKFINFGAYTDPDTIPYIQFFTVGGNMTPLAKDKFMNSSKPEMTEQLFNAVNEFFTPDHLYIVCTRSDNVKEQIPMNVYDVDFDSIDVGEKGMKVDNIPDNYFNKNKKPEVFLENLVTLSPYVVFNDAELALSIFIAFKELMPK